VQGHRDSENVCTDFGQSSVTQKVKVVLYYRYRVLSFIVYNI